MVSEMRKEYDFSQGERGKFFKKDAKFNLPVYLEDDILDYLENIARNECGIIVPRPNFKTDELHEIIIEILGNKKYKKNIKELREKIKKYNDDIKLYPPKIAALKINDFLDNKKESYFINS